MRIATWSFPLIALVIAAGCGGQSAGEQLAGRARDADGVCARAERAIAARGDPRLGPGYVRDVSAAAKDARAAVRGVLALDVPEGAAGTVKPVRDAIEAADGDLRTLARITDRTTPAAVTEMIDELQESAEDLTAPARAAGLRTCGRPEARDAALDAMKAPVFAIQFNVYAAEFVKRLARLREGAGASKSELEDALIGYALAIGDAQNELDRMRAPRWALSDVDDYKEAVLELRAAVGNARAALLDHRGIGRRLSAVDRAERAHLRAALSLQRSLERRGPGDTADEPA